MSEPKREPLARLKLGEVQGAPSSISTNASKQQGSQPAKSLAGLEPKASLFVRLRSLINTSAKPESTDSTPDETYRNLALSLGNEAVQPPLSEDGGEHGPQSSSEDATPPLKAGH